jgi:hypothetical protein
VSRRGAQDRRLLLAFMAARVSGRINAETRRRDILEAVSMMEITQVTRAETDLMPAGSRSGSLENGRACLRGGFKRWRRKSCLAIREPTEGMGIGSVGRSGWSGLRLCSL